MNNIQWTQVQYPKYNTIIKTPRLTTCFGFHIDDIPDDFHGYKPESIPKGLLKIKSQVEKFCDHDFNYILMSLYRDGNDSIRAHRDTHLSFGPNPVIIGLSIGESRILRVRRLHNPNVFKSLKVEKSSDENIDFVLEENSIFVMAGYSQIYFSHEIPKMEDKGTRYSLTFREFIDKSNDNKSNDNKSNDNKLTI